MKWTTEHWFLLLSIWIGWKVIWSLINRFILGPADLNLYGSQQRWAIVTGGTDGIGKALVLELADRGWKKLIILGRNPEKAERLRTKLEKRGCQVKIFLTDLARIESIERDELISNLSSFDLGLLINNIGIMPASSPEYLVDQKSDKIEQTILINITFTTLLTKAVIESIIQKDRPENEKSAILMISSFAGLVPIPLMSVYSASKAYLVFLGKALVAEYDNFGIDLMVITPGATVPTNLSGSLGQTEAHWWRGTSSPEEVAKGSLNKIGQAVIWSPTWIHSIQESISSLIPSKWIFKINQIIRNKAN